jgi:hypothetical protein
MRVYLNGGGINWCWYLDVTLNDATKTAEIHAHWRAHKFEQRGYHPDSTFAGYQLIEGVNRVVTGVTVHQKGSSSTYRISNPKYVFDYGEGEPRKVETQQ